MFNKLIDILNRPNADPVGATYPLMGSAWPMTLILISYMYFVLKCGKLFMAKREAYKLKTVLMVYNVYNAMVFAYIFYHMFIEPKYDFRCMETMQLDDPHKNVERYISYAYYINKVIDLLDTVFFVLRKSYKQITFLHVYHHAMMVFAVYWVSRLYGFGAQFAVLGLLNSFVHAIMYYYYFISAMYPSLKQSIWWKQYITITQLLQFVLIGAQCLWILVYNQQCKFPKLLQFGLLIQSVTFIIMFSNFYYHTYVKPKPKVK
ncbi:elongation of very long chain fatty acids protein F-like [Drosophila busckii]|uniref:elongation of very long chain fatty acids protein F-like n=1 Tax=Drosophila busckii TaxID=30019 RepID=UPI001432D345|nr:elongation of very long chain fatty acids protein F-like [Drosophila busckii]